MVKGDCEAEKPVGSAQRPAGRKGLSFRSLPRRKGRSKIRPPAEITVFMAWGDVRGKA